MKFVIGHENAGERLDNFLSDAADMTRSRAGALIRGGNASVNGAIASKTGLTLRNGDSVELTVPEPEPSVLLAQDIPVEIVYQDDCLAVVFKPSGMVVHPAAGNRDGTLVNALLSRLDGLSGIGGTVRPGIVHRIDKDTSGLLLIAKNDFSHVRLASQIQAHTLERAYLAIVCGELRSDEGDIDKPVGRSPNDRKKMAVVEGGREAKTHYRVLEKLKGCTLIECVLSTGRTHQIRVHMASIGHPVLGDPLYGFKKPPRDVAGGQLLHAYKLGFTHPATGERLVFTKDPEPRFLDWLKKLRA